MWIIGLTGAIGSGKSTLSNYLRSRGVPVHCADQAIHELLDSDLDVCGKIKALWPHVFVKGKINRLLLSEQVMSSCKELRILEGILYPKLARLQKKFITEYHSLNAPLVVFDVPLLLEVGLQSYCHSVILVTAPCSLRKRRVLKRKDMTLAKFENFESNQMDDLTRRKYADFIIPTGRGKASSLQMIKEVLDQISSQPPPKWQGQWPEILQRETEGERNCTGYGNNRV